MLCWGSGDPLLDFKALTRDQAAALQEVTVDSYTDGKGEEARTVKRVKFRLADKRAALVDIAKYLGMFVERHEHSGKDGAPIRTQAVADETVLAVLRDVGQRVRSIGVPPGSDQEIPAQVAH